jgi:hypothetical protein
MALKGQAFTQVPHPEHLAISTLATCLAESMAECAQVASHAAQRLQASRSMCGAKSIAGISLVIAE